MKVSNILLISKNPEQAEMILSQLKTLKGYRIYFEKNAPEIIRRIRETPIDMLVMNLDYFGPTQLILVKQIRELQKNLKSLILAERINPNASRSAEKISDITIWGKYFITIETDFKGVFKRVASGEKIAKRTSKRHRTKQAATVKILNTGQVFKCHVFNLSTTGAYLEFEKGHLNVADKVQVIIPLKDLKKTHIVRCKIAWISTDLVSHKSAGLSFESSRLGKA